MVSSKELKRRAWASIEGRYWSVFLASLVGGELAAIHASLSSSVNFSGSEETIKEVITSSEWGALLVAIFGGVAIFVTLLSLLLCAFVSGPAKVGLCRYFIINTERKTPFKVIFSGFTTNYMGNAKIMFLVHIKTLLWTMLFIVPGIIKGYEYAMIPYILAENPEISRKEAFELSKKMMTGNKWKLFKLEFSFIGWYLLGFLMCCVGMLFVPPYEYAAYAEFYLEAKAQIQEN